MGAGEVCTGIMSPAFAQAFIDAQGAIEGAVKGKSNPAFKSKYADLGACWDACSAALQANKIGVIQLPCTPASPGHIGLLTMLVYGPTGETLGSAADFPLKDPTNAQAAGSALTYARRYSLCSVIGICPEDDDGNAASTAGNRGKTSGAAKQPAEGTLPSQSGAGYKAEFGGAANLGERKAVYGRLKLEPDFAGKQELLTEFVEVIKDLVAKETK